MFSMSSNQSTMEQFGWSSIYLCLIAAIRLILENNITVLKLGLLVPLLIGGIIWHGFILFTIAVIKQRRFIGYGGLIINSILLLNSILTKNLHYVPVALLSYMVSINGIIYTTLILLSLELVLTLEKYSDGINWSGAETFKIIIKIYVGFLIGAKLLVTDISNTGMVNMLN